MQEYLQNTRVECWYSHDGKCECLILQINCILLENKEQFNKNFLFLKNVFTPILHPNHSFSSLFSS